MNLVNILVIPFLCNKVIAVLKSIKADINFKHSLGFRDTSIYDWLGESYPAIRFFGVFFLNKHTQEHANMVVES